ncbi:hypothetical protein H0H93_000939, partial [Arthromyces matolae]
MTYSFGDTVEGIPITKKIGLPELLPLLKEPPKELSEWEIDALERIARAIDQHHKALLRKIMDDSNKIERATTFVLSRGRQGFRPGPTRDDTIQVPKWPEEGSDYAQALAQMIKDSHRQLQRA